MATKRNMQNQIAPELQIYLDKIAAKYQPNDEVLKRHMDNAEARYNKYQNFGDIPVRLVEKLQSLILDGWRYSTTNPQPVMSNTSMLSVTLQKPDSLVAQELETLRANISEKYHTELFNAMEAEIDILISEAAEDAKRKADEQVATDQLAMRKQLRNLLTGAIV
ncbi:hypothetical protein M979_0477 [Buttiauxella noackiae ATCC 51607]|uniref:Uncharacterized protein n=1 Tax=Buttiauxella noackiae ATCC 51607 TaxID=1354255 RepID=A0A1B7HYG2_9ENTR|nr:hypothetical protein [Buttiauxella noackiae]OAT20749.1 hypothetical protein M979_0477 [Buttiauxella noackiae ATCC 51607]